MKIHYKMGRLRQADIRGLAEALAECHGLTNLNDFATRTTRALLKLIPADTASYNEIDARQGQVRTVIVPASPGASGHLLFMPLEDDRRALATEIAVIKATPRQDGVDKIRIPGERAYRDRARRARTGIEVDRRIHDALIRLAEARRDA